MVFPAWLEAVVPLAIVTVAVAAMGGSQGGIQQLFFGKPKLVGADHWDRLLDERDARIKQEAK
jgi:NADH dehydrogenase (ubiquinone) 1 alpha subcomplex subunit 1